MKLLSMHRILVSLNSAGLVLVSAIYVVTHGVDRELLSVLGWVAFAAVGTFLGGRFLSRGRYDSERADDRVDGSQSEKRMVEILFWTPAIILAILVALVAALEKPLPSVAWMMVVIGGYIGRDIEALNRLRRR